MRGLTLPVVVATLSLAVAAQAQPAAPAANPAPAQAPAPSAAAPVAAPADPVLARVGGEEIHASDLADAAQSLPEELRGMPPQMLYPMLLDQLVDRRAIVLAARKQGLDKDPAVQKPDGPAPASRCCKTALLAKGDPAPS